MNVTRAGHQGNPLIFAQTMEPAAKAVSTCHQIRLISSQQFNSRERFDICWVSIAETSNLSFMWRSYSLPLPLNAPSFCCIAYPFITLQCRSRQQLYMLFAKCQQQPISCNSFVYVVRKKSPNYCWPFGIILPPSSTLCQLFKDTM